MAGPWDCFPSSPREPLGHRPGVRSRSPVTLALTCHLCPQGGPRENVVPGLLAVLPTLMLGTGEPGSCWNEDFSRLCHQVFCLDLQPHSHLDSGNCPLPDPRGDSGPCVKRTPTSEVTYDGPDQSLFPRSQDLEVRNGNIRWDGLWMEEI